MLYLTSFVEARGAGRVPLSTARWAPDFARRWRVLEFFQPMVEGRAVLLRQFPNVEAYYANLTEMFLEREGEIVEWYEGLDDRVNYSLACWCPHTKKAREQIGEHGSMVCHLGAVARVLDHLIMPWNFTEEHRTLIARPNRKGDRV